MLGPDLQLLAEAARAAGPIALRHWKASPQVWEKPGLGPVTEADLAVNVMLESRLRTARPGYGWLSEESPDDMGRLECEYVFIIDPIDGTRAFIAGEKHFSHSLAIARNGEVTAAAVYLPALDKLYLAEAGGSALMNDAPISAQMDAPTDQASFLISKGVLSPDHWEGPVPDLHRNFRASLAYRLCLVADGSFDGMLTLRDSWEWDIAAGSLIAERAGALVTDRLGQRHRFNSKAAKSTGIFVAPPKIHTDLLPRLKA